MLNLVIREELLYHNAVIMGILFFAGCALFGWIWKRFNRSSTFRWLFIGGIALLGILWMVGMIFCRPPDHDEIEHTSAAFQISQGMLPFQDFFQHHSPMAWILVAPLFHIPFISAYPLDSIRILSTVISLFALIILMHTAKLVWKESHVKRSVILLFMGNFLSVELFNFRPDLIANVFTLGAFYLILKNQKFIVFALSGILLGFTISLSPKYLPYLILVPLFILIHHRDWRYYLRAFGIHLIGIMIGLLPLFLWLIHHDLLRSFYEWVLVFNKNRLSTGENLIGGKFQLIPTIFALWGCLKLIRSPEKESRGRGQWLMIMLILSAMIYLNPSKNHFEYYQQMYILATLIAAAGPLNRLLEKWLRHSRAILAFLLIGVICWSGIHETQNRLRKRDYTKGREIIQNLQKIAGSDAVICITPDHPITSPNAVYISTGWQYLSWLMIPGCRDHLKNLVQEIEIEKPVIILNKVAWPLNVPAFPEYLENQGVLTVDEARQLQDYLQSQYHLLRIQEREFWIRNDQHEKFSDLKGVEWSLSN